MKRGFTLIEVLVVIAIIAIIAAILLPVFGRAKEASKKTSCLSNSLEISRAMSLYISDSDGFYPQTKERTDSPEDDDAAGGFEEPDSGSVFELLRAYIGASSSKSKSSTGLYMCPSDADSSGKSCQESNPDAPDVNSYLVNGFFVFGLNESAISKPASTILISERRSEKTDGAAPFCDYMYRPWWNSKNPDAPEDEMNETTGAIATRRHVYPNYGFADGHAKSLPWAQTYAPPTVNLHLVKQP